MMQRPDKISTRKKFLLGGAAILTSLAVFKKISARKSNLASQNNKDAATVKMLSQDGELVEVDVEKLYCGKRKKISDEQLKNWISKKTNSLK